MQHKSLGGLLIILRVDKFRTWKLRHRRMSICLFILYAACRYGKPRV